MPTKLPTTCWNLQYSELAFAHEVASSQVQPRSSGAKKREEKRLSAAAASEDFSATDSTANYIGLINEDGETFSNKKNNELAKSYRLMNEF